MEGIQNNEADSSRHRSNSSSSKAVPEHNTSGFLWTKLRIFKHSSDCCQHQFLSPSSPSKPWFYALYFFFHVWQMRVVIVRSSDEKKDFEFLVSFPDDKAHRVIFGLKRVFFQSTKFISASTCAMCHFHQTSFVFAIFSIFSAAALY